MISSSDKFATDRRYLATQQYGTAANLLARQETYRYQVPQRDFVGWALGQMEWPDGACVLDAGCGPGLYLRALAAATGSHSPAVGLDLSIGMLREVHQRWNAAAPVTRPPCRPAWPGRTPCECWSAVWSR